MPIPWYESSITYLKNARYESSYNREPGVSHLVLPLDSIVAGGVSQRTVGYRPYSHPLFACLTPKFAVYSPTPTATMRLGWLQGVIKSKSLSGAPRSRAAYNPLRCGLMSRARPRSRDVAVPHRCGRKVSYFGATHAQWFRYVANCTHTFRPEATVGHGSDPSMHWMRLGRVTDRLFYGFDNQLSKYTQSRCDTSLGRTVTAWGKGITLSTTSRLQQPQRHFLCHRQSGRIQPT